MERSVIFAGFGGQGILFAGTVLARAGMAEGLEVLWIPSYGPEMRGGTASCTVIVAPEMIGSPIVDKVDPLIALNPSSLAKFEQLVATGGLLVVNTSLIEASPRDPTSSRCPSPRRPWRGSRAMIDSSAWSPSVPASRGARLSRSQPFAPPSKRL